MALDIVTSRGIEALIKTGEAHAAEAKRLARDYLCDEHADAIDELAQGIDALVTAMRKLLEATTPPRII